MIRPTTPDDTAALIALADATGIFGSNELEELSEMLADYFGGNIDSDHFWITDDDNGPVGIAYYAPEPMTDGTWNLYLLAVRPDRQGQGRGTTLLRYVEQTLTARGERVRLGDTSGRGPCARAPPAPTAGGKDGVRHCCATWSKR